MSSTAIIVVLALMGAVLLFSDQQANGQDISSGKGPDISVQQKTGAAPLSFSQVAQLALDAGFDVSALPTIVAICFAESGGNPDALNSNGTVAPPEGSATDVYSVGLWQINLKAHRNYETINLFDPRNNAIAAFEIFSSQGLTAWGAYNSGNYRAYLNQAAQAANA